MLSKGLTVIRTLKKNKREITKEFLPHKDREIKSFLFAFIKDFTIASYVSKKNKSVILVSYMHHDNSVDESTNKPEIILQYNSTKVSVDAVDQILLDMRALNAYIIQQGRERASKMTHMTFLKGLAKSLCELYMKKACYNQRLSTQLRTIIATALQICLPTPGEPSLV
ncbi:hypothetical protein EVAR_66483_1 [Eumeta japonica]|uniref:PiggyBac transposable element-derived protein domain-containing protein n=1 Tax=Eumeta variegata TaxID=151549 RepID=A0A4C1ZYX8_EUMVA|nr:hypothetical protein EVAR_66483_1 [Eumeta japonica]